MTRAFRFAAAALALTCLGAALAQTLTLELGRDRRDRLVVQSQASDADGNPITRHEVAFFLLPDFFPNEGSRINGLHDVPLGSDTTDATGTAERRIEPPYSGPTDIEARLIDASGTVLATTQATFDLVRTADPQPEPIEPPLAGVRRPIEIGILVAVVAVWVLLVVVLVSTLASIRRLGRAAAQP